MNKPKSNQPDVETFTTTCTSCNKYPLKNYKYIPPIHYLQELKRDVSTKGNLTPFQIRCFEQIEKALNQPDPTIEEVKKEWEDDGWKCREYKTFITFIDEIDKISFTFFYKGKEQDDLDCCEIENHSEEPLIITNKLNHRITKTFKALGWEV